VNTAVCLAGYGLAVAVVAPGWLARVAGSGLAPRVGVAAWLAALATVVGSWLAAAAVLIHSARLPLVLLGCSMVVASAIRAGWAGVVTCREIRARSAAHGRMVAILGRRDPGLGVVVVEAAEPLVYCLRAPAPTVVVTTGAQRVLNAAQLSAALAHERAHLAGRHHLLLAVAQAAGRAAPWLTLFAHAGPALTSLLEMRADDAAAHRHGRRTVAAAIAAMSVRSAPAGALGAAGPSALTRGMRLCVVEPVWRVRVGQLGLALTVLLLGAGPYLWAALPVCPHPWW
jgi:Zn-dependent protease with chaperone function